MAGIAELQSSGQRIDLRKGSAEFLDDLKDTMRTETRYERTFDLACADKWTVDGEIVRNPCRTCPQFTADPSNPRALLCALGRQQETIVDSYLAARSMEALDDALCASVEADFDAALELAEALL